MFHEHLQNEAAFLKPLKTFKRSFEVMDFSYGKYKLETKIIRLASFAVL
jgi:hypothetical protein